MVIDFSDRIRNLREDHNMTQTELGRKLGVTKAVVSSYETGLHQPKHELLLKISRIFGVSVGYLYGIEDEVISSPNKTSIDLSGLDEEDVSQVIMLIRLLKSKNGEIQDAQRIVEVLPENLKNEVQHYFNQNIRIYLKDKK